GCIRRARARGTRAGSCRRRWMGSRWRRRWGWRWWARRFLDGKGHLRSRSRATAARTMCRGRKIHRREQAMKTRNSGKSETDEGQRRLAVLIDADNAQPSVIEGLLAEVAKFGVASVKRIYGDF